MHIVIQSDNCCDKMKDIDNITFVSVCYSRYCTYLSQYFQALHWNIVQD